MLNCEVINNNKKEWIVFLHGFGGNSNILKKQEEVFSKDYNILIIDISCHGLSKENALYLTNEKTFGIIAKEVLQTMSFYKIKKAHICGLGLGTIISSVISKIAPHRVESLILAGLLTSYSKSFRKLFDIAKLLKGIVHYMFIYISFAWILMPKKNHMQSRHIFIKEAKKLGKIEFYDWFNLLESLEKDYPLDEFINEIPKLVIMGQQDHMFLLPAMKFVNMDDNAMMKVIENSGHIVNIEQSEEFNNIVSNFLKSKCKIQERQFVGNITKEVNFLDEKIGA